MIFPFFCSLFHRHSCSGGAVRSFHLHHRGGEENRRETGRIDMALRANDNEILVYGGGGLEKAIKGVEVIAYNTPQIRELITSVQRLHARMKGAERKPITTDTGRLAFQEAKQFLLDVEDLFDELVTDDAVKKMSAHTQPPAQSKVIMKTSVKKMTRRSLYLIGQIPIPDPPKSTGEERQTSSLLPYKKHIIGRDGEKLIIDKLLSSTPIAGSTSDGGSVFSVLPSPITGSGSDETNFSVLPIIGMGGMGKTSLAQLVFNDKKVKSHFDLMMWVCVSNNPDPERLTKAMIESAMAFKGIYETCQTTNWDLMQQALYMEVEGKTFLLVLDDVWGVEGKTFMWEKIFTPLHFAKRGSKVIVTARSRAFVDKIEAVVSTPLLLRGLSDDATWNLLKRYALRGVANNAYVMSYLEGIRSGIVPRLKGSPLAAKSIGSLLDRLDEQHWKSVLESPLWKLELGEDGIWPALQLSYLHLSPDLKQCFAYCSLFPKGCRFSKLVTQLWEGLSLIRKSRGTRTLQAKGQTNFDVLLYNSFFETAPEMFGEVDVATRRSPFIPETKRPGENEIFAMHDLAEFVAMGNDCLRLEDQTMAAIPNTIRHMSICVTEFGQMHIERLCNHAKLRSLIFLTSYTSRINLSRDELDKLFQSLKMLRVLCLNGCGVKELPSSVGDLKHLRHIDLGCNDLLMALPDRLGDLYNLQVLNLEQCNSLIRLPDTMSRLINLSHLRTDEVYLASHIHGLGKLTSLQELQIMGDKVNDLGGMSMLRELTVIYLNNVRSKEEANKAKLHTMKHLQTLRLSWDVPKNGDCYPKLEEEVLQALRPNDSLQHLQICGYGGINSPDWMQNFTPSSFSSLKYVSLVDARNWRVLPCSSLSQLHHLESLNIAWMCEWEEWSHPVPLDDDQYLNPQQHSSVTPEFFPCLRELRIKHCPKLKDLPLLPPTLEILDLTHVGVSSLPGLWAYSSSHLSQPSSLSKLYVSDCGNLSSIRELLQHELPNLEVIRIEYCRNLAIFPERGFGHLMSLKEKLFIACPNLSFPSIEDYVSRTRP